MKMNYQTQYLLKMSAFFITIASLIVISLTSVWLNRVIFNTERFTTITTSVFAQQSSRDSVSNLIANKIFENRPLLKATLSGRLSSYISGLLASDTATISVDKLAREGQLLFTSPRREPVVIDLSGVKPIIASAQELIQKNESEQRINIADIPDSITIIDTQALPNFHRAAVLTHLLGPLSLLCALILAGVWLARGGKANRYKRSRMLMVVVFGSALVAIIIGPLAEPSFISLGRDAPSQTLLSNLYKGFITPFRNQAMWLGATSAILLIITTITYELSRRYAINISITKK